MPNRPNARERNYDVVIIGAGPSGLSALIKLREQGIRKAIVLDRADRVGGTWAINDYPGLRCDIPSEMYSLGYAPNPDWSRTFAPQAEIQQYLEGVAERFGVRAHIRLGTEVTGAAWNEQRARWEIVTATGDRYCARVFVPATGFIGEARMPRFPGQDTFRGTLFHSGMWNHDHDVSGETVAVIGSGASAIQFLPAIQPRAGRVISFQRTPGWVLPKPDYVVPEQVRKWFRRLPRAHRLVREAALLAAEPLLPMFMSEQALRRLAHPLGERNIRRSIRDPALRAALTPDHTLGCKRPLLSSEWYEALAQPNVEVVCQGVTRITADGVIAEDGTEYPVDTIIFGTGYAVADPAIYAMIRGADGRTLSETWQGCPRAYQGMAIHNFPNMFMMLGPNSHSVVGSVMWTSEHQGIYIAQAVRRMLDRQIARLEVRREVQERFNARIDKRLARLPIQPEMCSSYYMDAQGRNRFVWPEWGFVIRHRLTHFRLHDYDVRQAARPAAEHRTPALGTAEEPA